LKIQYANEETREIRKEKAINASIPDREITGIENQYEEKPLKVKSSNLNPGTMSVTR